MQSSLHHHAADPIPRVRDSAKLAEQLERNSTENVKRSSRVRKSFDGTEVCVCVYVRLFVGWLTSRV